MENFNIEKLNKKYKFFNVKNIEYKIELDYKGQFDKFNIEKNIKEILEFDKKNIKSKLQKVLINRKNYYFYTKEYNELINQTKKLNIFKRLFVLFYFKTKKINPILDIDINICVSYRSPAGRSYYEKNYSYNYDELVMYAKKSIDKKIYSNINTQDIHMDETNEEQQLDENIIDFEQKDEQDEIIAEGELIDPIKIIDFDGNEIIEKYDEHISKYDKIKKTKYFKEKYLNKNINNYTIIDIKAEEQFEEYPYHMSYHYIYFYCKCNNCERIIKQSANNFLIDPIICKCKDKKEKDIEWEKRLIPYKARIIYLSEDEQTKNTKDFSIDNIMTYYTVENNELKRNGFDKITELNVLRDYIIGSYCIYIGNGNYIKYNNVYYNLKDNKFNPRLFYKEGDKYIELSNDKNNILPSEKMQDIYFITYERKKEWNDNFLIKIFHNKELKLCIDIYFGLADYEIVDNTYLVAKNNFKIEKVGKINGIEKNCIPNYLNCKFTYNMVNNEIIFNNGDLNNLNDFYNTNTNIKINTSSNIISKDLKDILDNIEYIDNEKYKRIYIQKNDEEENIILLKYLNKKTKLIEIENEFNDDKFKNYLAIIERSNIETINFVEHVISKTINWYGYYSKYFTYRIYDHSINSIVSLLINENDLKTRIINLLENSDLFITKNNYKKNNIILKIKNIQSIPEEYSKNYKLIIEKLKEKYNTDDLGLFLIILKKYGEEIAFNLQTILCADARGVQYYYPKVYAKNEKLYNDILNEIEVPKIKWKSEHKLFTLISTYFPDAIFQYKFEELGNQSLDIYIPSLNIAFEYQGEQHYQSIEKFGGELGFITQKNNDIKKKEICKENNIILIEWSYEEKINKLVLDEKLLEYKDIVKGYYNFSGLI